MPNKKNSDAEICGSRGIDISDYGFEISITKKCRVDIFLPIALTYIILLSSEEHDTIRLAIVVLFSVPCPSHCDIHPMSHSAAVRPKESTVRGDATRATVKILQELGVSFALCGSLACELYIGDDTSMRSSSYAHRRANSTSAPGVGNPVIPKASSPFHQTGSFTLTSQHQLL